MELNITTFFNESAPMDYSASAAEIGQNAGADIWRAACDDSADYMMLDDDDKRQAFRDYVKGFGAWSDEEIVAWSDVELNALLIQLIAGDMREADLHAGMTADEWQSYQHDAESGRVAGNIFGGSDGQIYYFIGY